LLKALAGAELAIVTPIAGTTRDVVTQAIQIEGVPVHVIDTAGLRDSDDPVEKIGIERAWAQIERADALVFLHDLTRRDDPAYQAADAQIQRLLADKRPNSLALIEVWNKADAHAGPAPEGSIALSARTGQGLQALRQKLLEVAGWQSSAEGVWLARERHVHALRRVEQHLAAANEFLAPQALALDLLAEELRLGQNALNEITGEFSADDLLGVIFSKFCIGK
jgi:tRNA modification GTPase